VSDCPGRAEGHVWVAEEPPDWMDVSDWRDPEWDDWYDQADRHCMSCGMSDD
jgi:hypothetical protein